MSILSKRATGSFLAHAVNSFFGTYAVPEASSWPRMRNVLNSRASGRRLARARGGLRRPRRDREQIVAVDDSPGDAVAARLVGDVLARVLLGDGVDSPYWLFSTMNSTGSFQTAARLTASWKSPSLVDRRR
jgi:hypothetical protein